MIQNTSLLKYKKSDIYAHCSEVYYWAVRFQAENRLPTLDEDESQPLGKMSSNDEYPS